jgi:nucleoside-diphosphate-sugar epimerase
MTRLQDKTLIIGGNGYIGSSLYNYLKQDGVDVHCVDLCLYEPDLGFCFKIDFRHLPITYFKDFETIVLLAGNSSVKSCEGNQISSLKNNVENFLLLLEKIKGKRLIYASSSSVYGNTYNEVATEANRVFTPITTYDLTKQIIDYYIQLYDVEYYGLRFGTVNGYGFSKTVRQDIMINAMVKCSKETGVLNCINPEVNRPILDINDLCRAVYQIMKCNKDQRGLYNLASFNGTVLEISKAVSELCKSTILTKHEKGQLLYDFKISSEEFSDRFDFTFLGTPDRIVRSLLENYDRIQFTNRSKELTYVP